MEALAIFCYKSRPCGPHLAWHACMYCDFMRDQQERSDVTKAFACLHYLDPQAQMPIFLCGPLYVEPGYMRSILEHSQIKWAEGAGSLNLHQGYKQSPVPAFCTTYSPSETKMGYTRP